MRSKIVRSLIGGGTHVVRSHICIEGGEALKKLLQRMSNFAQKLFLKTSFQDLTLGSDWFNDGHTIRMT